MKDYLRKTGLAAVIVISIAATAFLPKRISQWVILTALLVWLGTVLFAFVKKHRTDHPARVREKRNTSYEKSITAQEKAHKGIEMHLSHRITDKLHSAYPDATWRWKSGLTSSFLENGGSARIETSNTDEFNEADITVDSFGRISVEMIKSQGIGSVIQGEDENANIDYTTDVSVWYDAKGKALLTDIINELNAKGSKSLTICEDGNVIIGEGESVGVLPAFPTKNLWTKLSEIIEGEGLKIVQNETSLEIGW